MLSSFVAALALAASVSNVAAGPIHHVSRGYAQDADLLEDYTPYHVRYLALGCSGKHRSDFFEKCCHPLLRWQKLEDRPSECTPSPSASSSAVLAEPTSPPVDNDPIPDYDDDCEDESTTQAPSSTYTPPAATPKSSTKTAQATNKPETTPAPETTNEPEPTPQPTTTKESTSAAPEPTKGSGGGDVNKGGFATFFDQGGVAGACGTVHDNYDKVVALDYRRYGDLGKQSSDCGRTVTITNTKNGKSVTAIVADACPTCKNENCLDLSMGAFDQIATREEGMVPIEWSFN